MHYDYWRNNVYSYLNPSLVQTKTTEERLGSHIILDCVGSVMTLLNQISVAHFIGQKWFGLHITIKYK